MCPPYQDQFGQPSDQDDYNQPSNHTEEDYCAIKRVLINPIKKDTEYCDMVFAFDTFFSAVTFTLLGVVGMLGATSPATVTPAQVASSGVVNWDNNPLATATHAGQDV